MFIFVLLKTVAFLYRACVVENVHEQAPSVLQCDLGRGVKTMRMHTERLHDCICMYTHCKLIGSVS